MHSALPLLLALASPLSPETHAEIARVVDEARQKTGAPSVSVAVVRDGAVVFAETYGDARLSPPLKATPAMTYNIGSVSKQLAAAAALLLVEDGLLELDAPIARYLDVPHAKEVTLRQLLSHTAGYRDYWPEDYVLPDMLKPTTPRAIVGRWARELDFAPGSDYQYSNTGYTIAGLVVEKVAGRSLLDVLRTRIFKPLGMDSVTLAYGDPRDQPQRHTRFANAPVRTAPPEAEGWLFATGDLRMSAADLARWNAALLGRRVFKDPKTHDEMERVVLLRSGATSQYALGQVVRLEGGRRVIEHGGAVIGFAAYNARLPDDGLAVSVLTNMDPSGGDAAEIVGAGVRKLLVAEARGWKKHEERTKAIVEALQHGRIDAALFTPACRTFFTPTALADYAASLHPRGAPKVKVARESRRGGLVTRVYDVDLKEGAFEVVERMTKDGLIQSWIIVPK